TGRDNRGAFSGAVGNRPGIALLEQIVELCLRHFQQVWNCDRHNNLATSSRPEGLRDTFGRYVLRITSAAFSAIMYTALTMKNPGIRGNTDASTTRSPCVPCTLKS